MKTMKETDQNRTITIFKRPEIKNISKEKVKILYPKFPYHQRWELYVKRRNEIFNISEISILPQRNPKRSTLRIRQYYRLQKLCKRLLVSAIITNPQDKRFYAKVQFLDITEYGLLDTGANISCIGSELAQKDFSKYNNFSKCKTFVKTADGQKQKVEGWIDVDISFRGKIKSIKLFIIPSISQKLILGLDFWRSFNLIPNILDSVDLLATDNNTNVTLSEIDSPDCKIAQNLEQSTDFIPLTTLQRN